MDWDASAAWLRVCEAVAVGRVLACPDLAKA